MDRRAFFKTLAGAGAFAALPAAAFASTPVPHLYMAESIESTLQHPFGPLEIETWRHTGDPEYKLRALYLKDTDYNTRHAEVTQHYKAWKGRPHG